MRYVTTLRRLSDSFRSNDDGQSIVELAVMAPLLLLLLVATIDLGFFAYDGIELGNAARAGAEYGAQSPGTASGGTVGEDPSAIVAVVQADAKQLADSSGTSTVTPINVTTYCACDSAKGTAVDCNATAPCTTSDRLDVFVKVDATNTFKPLLHIPGFSAQIPIERVAIQEMSPQ
jgi:Flp pilus assembly protein TadG